MTRSFVSLLVLALLGLASARMAYQFAGGSEDIIGEPVKEFSCDGRPYGYYADIDNDCRIFHVCNPVADFTGEVASMEHFSFMCGNHTVFSQESLTCVHEDEAFPCEESATLYDVVNGEFGKVLIE
ncbi:U-scoloptoxin(01)-Cw1a-like [Oratosquilla oratoria]|uniref:U-scoloptoxin(01)-Cw1a-like n=1 Tax=Oratosquilla oratoria TaxID=337810 RepID=UPI003F75DA14